jgi:hypothetical protein
MFRSQSEQSNDVKATISMTGTLSTMCVLNIDDSFIIYWLDFHITQMCPYVLGNDRNSIQI